MSCRHCTSNNQSEFNAEISVVHRQLKDLAKQLTQNSIEAVIIMLAVATLLKSRDRRIKRRFQEIGYLNHHIRNAPAVIEMAQNFAEEAQEREELVSSSTLRIQLCLQKVSRQEDLIDVANLQRTSAKREHRRAS